MQSSKEQQGEIRKISSMITAKKQRKSIEWESKGEKERDKHLNVEFQRIARRDKKAFLSEQCEEIEKKTEQERPEISSRKLEIPRENFMKRWA